MTKKVLSLATPPEVLELQIGDTCRVEVNFDYVGPEVKNTRFYAAIGVKGIWFDEKVAGYTYWTIPKTTEKTTYTAHVDILITSAIKVGSDYDMYAKLDNVPGPDIYSEYLRDIIDIVEEAPPPQQCPLSVYASPSEGGSITRNPSKSLYADGEMIDVTATANSGWSFDKFTGDDWETTVNPVRVRGCRTTSVTAHFVEEAPPPLDYVRIKLKNWPAGSYGFAVAITSHDLSSNRGGLRVGLDGTTSHEGLTPESKWFPIYVSAVVFNSDMRPIWQMTSHPDNDWLAYYNPDFVIPSGGDWVINVATGRFEPL